MARRSLPTRCSPPRALSCSSRRNGLCSPSSMANSPKALRRMPAPERCATRGRSFGVDVSAAFFQSAFVSIPRVDAFEKVHQVRPRLIETGARSRGLEGKIHHDIGSGECLAEEPWSLAQFTFQEVEMKFQLSVDERSGRPPQKPESVDHELEQQRWHKRALGIVQPVFVAPV